MPDPTLFDLPLPAEPQAPYQRHSPTSRAAAVSVGKSAHHSRERVLAFLRSRGAMGATDLEIQEALEMDGSTQRPRRIELVKAGLVLVTARCRASKSGRAATVYCAKE